MVESPCLWKPGHLLHTLILTQLQETCFLEALLFAAFFPPNTCELSKGKGNVLLLFPGHSKCQFEATHTTSQGLPRWLSGKGSTCQSRRLEFDPWVGKIPWRRKWQPILVLLPEESHGQRSLEGYTVHGVAELDMPERPSPLHTTSLPGFLAFLDFTDRGSQARL